MMGFTKMRPAMLCCILAGAVAVCRGQKYQPPPPPLTTLPPCPADKTSKEYKKKVKENLCDPTNVPAPAAKPLAGTPTPVAAPPPDSAAQKFPYPGNTPATPTANPTQQFPYPGDHADDQEPRGENVADPNVPHDPAAEKKAAETSAGKSFPYPGDPAPATTSGGAATQDSSSSSSSSSTDDASAKKSGPAKGSSNDDDDDDQPKLTDKGSEGKRNRKTIKPQTDTERVDEDLSVAKFYGQHGNSMGAYLRAKDAVKTQPDFPEAHFVLGEAAQRLKKVDEAKAEFTAYLKLAPDGERAGAAEKALETLK